MTSPSGAEQEVELQGSSWAGALLVTLTTCASNHAPMLVSRASTYSLTCEERERSHPARAREGGPTRGTGQGPLPVRVPTPGMRAQGLQRASCGGAVGLWGPAVLCRAVRGTGGAEQLPRPRPLTPAAPPVLTTPEVPAVPWGQDHPAVLPKETGTAHFFKIAM